MSTPQSALNADSQTLIPGVGCSIFLHGAVGLGWLFFSVVMAQCGPSRPIIDPDKTMEVSMVVLKKTQKAVPDRAQRAPVPQGEATPEPAEVPPPPRESDLVFEKEKAKTNKGQKTDRDAALEELKRQQMLQELMNAPEGTTDRDATDPNSDSDISINAAGAGNRGDPEFAAYIAKVQAIFQQHFKPLGAITQGNPDLVTTMFIQVDPATGRITDSEVQKSSGIPAYDAAAERAVAEVTTIPLPPEKYLGLVASGYAVRFRPP